MAIRVFRRRGGPQYRRCGSEIVSFVPELVVWELRIPGTRRAALRFVEKAVYVIDQKGVRRIRHRLLLKLARKSGHHRLRDIKE